MSLHIFYSEDMGKTHFPHACINQNQLNQFCVNERKRERERKERRSEERRKKRRGKKGKTEYKNFNLWGKEKEFPTSQETFKEHISTEIMHHFVSFYFRTKI